MKPLIRIAAAAALAGACSAASAAPVAIAFVGTILTFKQAGSNVGQAGDSFTGKIVFDIANAPVTVVNDGGTVTARALAEGGCTVYVNGGCSTNNGAVPQPVILSASIDTALGIFSIGPATDGSFTSSLVSRVDGTANGGGQQARYTLGTYSSRFVANGDGYERTTYNGMVGLDLLAAFGGLFADPADLAGPLNTAALTSGIFNFASTEIRAQCTDVGLFSCQSGDYAGDAYPQVELFGNIRFVQVGPPAVVPEPASAALLLLGAVGLALAGRRRAIPVRRHK